MTQIVASDAVGRRIEEVLVMGNLSVLTAPERVEYFERVCTSLGLNPLTKPFEFITLNNKLTLYATKACTDQLRQIHSVSVSEPHISQIGDLYSVAVTATDKTGRQDSDMGIVNVKGLSGENLANAMLKAVTKAKRRVTLSICGLGMLDETEIEDIPASAKRPPVAMPQSKPPSVDTATGEVLHQPAIEAPQEVPEWVAKFNADRKRMGIGNSLIEEVIGARLSITNIEKWLTTEDGRTPDKLLSLAADRGAVGVR